AWRSECGECGCDGAPGYAYPGAARARCSSKVISVIRNPYEHVRPGAMTVNRQRGRGWFTEPRGRVRAGLATVQSPYLLRLIKSRLCDEAFSVIHVGRKREEREILAIHVVF